ncbi:Plasmid stabilization system protein ParE [Cyclonatronum proteinivorum]|uniref:Plasmid stabilization system protein ParE n=1 Tax=Cyclonatronum proteinivorum TaxID=1457365 RepID=A0A345UGW3_9BACT|nr:type II toxin-antitoxin system RelE/ParE family toxin [Cyclonatronum proteinivorum]AXI99714.1 Plasmid stabilization system protein ParE [Cyclonatronum proteinivorum]
MKEVQWTVTAIKTLQETSDFILEVWGTDVNKQFVEQLDYRIEQLQNNPELAPAFENTQFRRLVVHRTVSLFYVNTPQFIKILVIMG